MKSLQLIFLLIGFISCNTESITENKATITENEHKSVNNKSILIVEGENVKPHNFYIKCLNEIVQDRVQEVTKVKPLKVNVLRSKTDKIIEVTDYETNFAYFGKVYCVNLQGSAEKEYVGFISAESLWGSFYFLCFFDTDNNHNKLLGFYEETKTFENIKLTKEIGSKFHKVQINYSNEHTTDQFFEGIHTWTLENNNIFKEDSRIFKKIQMKKRYTILH